MLTLYMSCKGTFLFKAAKTPHATPGHVITLKDIMLLTNFRNAPLFITSAPPQLNLLNRTSSMEPPQSIRLNRSSSIEPPQSILLNRSSSTPQVINDNTLACLRQVEVLGPKRSRVNNSHS